MICPKNQLECYNGLCNVNGCQSLNSSPSYIPTPQPSLPQIFPNYGWICPVCGRGNSPSTPTCPCTPPLVSSNTITFP